jgi:CheY-like chemotaxis protein
MPLRPLHILLAEDNRMNQVVARKIIESEWPGTHIIVAETGVQALDMLRANQPDLVLMDLQMPEMEGTEATLIIRQEFEAPKKDIPILAMTAHALITQRR